MKNLFLITMGFLAFGQSEGAPVITAVASNGLWSTASSWDLNRLPTNGDTIIIPYNNTIVINADQNLSSSTVVLEVFGTLQFTNNNTKLQLDINSMIKVFTGGVILTNASASQQIKLGNSIIYKSNTGSVYGPEQADQNSGGFVPFTQIVLTVQFVSFSATRSSNDVLLQWSTSEEMNSGSYEVERGFDGSNWTSIATISAAGNSRSLTNYSYTDRNNTSKLSYYRIKEKDLDGRTTYTSIKIVKNETSSKTEISIASVQNNILLQFPSSISGTVRVRIVSLSGQVVEETSVKQPLGQVVLSTRFKGNYIVSVSNGQELNVARQVIL
ncbi:MAG: T9SS type A sorting domain-containing protein [Flavisolibacter sp.]